MIGYTTLGSNNFDAAAAYYDALLSELGASRMMDMDGFILWAADGAMPGFALARPFNGEPATVGNGGMVALSCSSQEQVQQVYNRALELGGSDEGVPGPRGDGFYAGYLRDPEGNKLNAFVLG